MKPYPKRFTNRVLIRTGVFADALKTKSSLLFLLYFIGLTIAAS